MIVKIKHPIKKINETKTINGSKCEIVEPFELYSDVIQIHRNHNTFDDKGNEIDILMLITNIKNHEAISVTMGEEGQIVYVMNDEGKTIERLI